LYAYRFTKGDKGNQQLKTIFEILNVINNCNNVKSIKRHLKEARKIKQRVIEGADGERPDFFSELVTE